MKFDEFNEPSWLNAHETRSDRWGDWLVLLLACVVLVGFIVGAIP